MFTKYNLAGRTIAITGSTGGLGAAVATALRERAANLALLDLDLAATEAQAASLGGPTVAHGWHADVTDLESLQQAMAGAANHSRSQFASRHPPGEVTADHGSLAQPLTAHHPP